MYTTKVADYFKTCEELDRVERESPSHTDRIKELKAEVRRLHAEAEDALAERERQADHNVTQLFKSIRSAMVSEAHSHLLTGFDQRA